VGEPFCKVFSELYGLDTVALRYFNVFGPGQYGNSAYSTVISAWLEALYFPRKKKGFIEGDGKQSRDFCYVDNVVQANIKAILAPKRFNGEGFNIAHGERTTLLEVKRLIEKYTGKKLKLEKRPSRLGDVRHTHADIAKASIGFGYRPSVTFEQGLKRTIEWYELRKH
jgi:nucleoside-diphosphate-sugar epimerase